MHPTRLAQGLRRGALRTPPTLVSRRFAITPSLETPQTLGQRVHKTQLSLAPVGTVHAALPNPSLKRSANGRPPGPGRWYAVHFHQPGPGVLPSSPA